MNKKTFQWLMALIVLMGMSTLACGAFSGDEEATAVPATEAATAVESEADEAQEAAPTEAESADSPPEESVAESPSAESEESEEPAEPEESATVAAAAGQAKTLAISAIAQPDDLSSYRMVMNAELTSTDENGTEVVETFLIDVAFSNAPEAMSMMMHVEGVEEAAEMGDIAMTQLEGTTYMVVPGFGCITTTEAESLGQENPFTELTDADTFMQDVSEAQFEGEEVINGIETLHYTFDETDIENGEVEWAEGHIYVAKDGGWLVRLTMEGEGVFDELAEEPEFGMMQLQIDITDINQTFDFSIPADCEAESAGGGDMPMTADAYEVSSLGGLLTF
jgi:hypothetical protein